MDSVRGLRSPPDFVPSGKSRWSSNNFNNRNNRNNNINNQEGSQGVKAVKVFQRSQFFKTRMCTSWMSSGSCKKGNSCSYAHSDEDLRPPINLTKTKLCSDFANNCCPYTAAECNRAHGILDLKVTPTFYKTQLCKYWMAGHCPAGSLCRHAHSAQECRSIFNDGSHQNRTSEYAQSRGDSGKQSECSSTKSVHQNKKSDQNLLMTDSNNNKVQQRSGSNVLLAILHSGDFSKIRNEENNNIDDKWPAENSQRKLDNNNNNKNKNIKIINSTTNPKERSMTEDDDVTTHEGTSSTNGFNPLFSKESLSTESVGALPGEWSNSYKRSSCSAEYVKSINNNNNNNNNIDDESLNILKCSSESSPLKKMDFNESRDFDEIPITPDPSTFHILFNMNTVADPDSSLSSNSSPLKQLDKLSLPKINFTNFNNNSNNNNNNNNNLSVFHSPLISSNPPKNNNNVISSSLPSNSYSSFQSDLISSTLSVSNCLSINNNNNNNNNAGLLSCPSPRFTSPLLIASGSPLCGPRVHSRCSSIASSAPADCDELANFYLGTGLDSSFNSPLGTPRMHSPLYSPQLSSEQPVGSSDTKN